MSWEDVVLWVIQKRKGGEITLQEIYKGVSRHPIVTAELRKLWKNGQPLYQCYIRSSLPRLKRKGLIANPRRAVYKSN